MAYKLIICAFFVALLSGCNAYHLSEETLNTEIEKHLREQPKQNIFIKLADGNLQISLAMKVTGLSVDLVERNGNGFAKMNLHCKVTGSLASEVRNVEIFTYVVMDVDSLLSLEQGNIYLVRPNIREIQVHHDDFYNDLLQTALVSYQDDIEDVMEGYFYKHPIYGLNNSTFEKGVKHAVKGLKIKEDEIVFQFY